MFGVLSKQPQQIIEQFTTHHDLFARWVSETLLQPVSLCAPAILVNEVGTISGRILKDAWP
jgi:hypothetical protein